MNEKTAKAIDELYIAFDDVPKPHFLDGCPCCIERKEIETLLSKPLREIAADELSSYASSLFLTVGDEGDFLYFLPRIFDISANDLTWWPDPEVAIGKLSFVEWKKWNEERVDAIESYFDAVFEAYVESGSYEADSWLCALARSKCGFGKYLEKLKKTTKGLISVYENNSESLMKGKLSNGFWDEVPEEKNELIECFGSADVRRLIDASYAEIHAINSEPGNGGKGL